MQKSFAFCVGDGDGDGQQRKVNSTVRLTVYGPIYQWPFVMSGGIICLVIKLIFMINPIVHQQKKRKTKWNYNNGKNNINGNYFPSVFPTDLKSKLEVRKNALKLY